MNINGAYYPSIEGELVVYPGPIHEVTATVDNNVGTPYVEVTQTPTLQGMDILFAFFNMKGEQGETGNGIQSIVKTSTVGLVDTYTITYTDGTTSTFNVTNGAKGDTGNGIQSIAKSGTSGLVDTYTITFTNGQTTTFTVTNGAKGDTGATGNGIASIAKTSTVGLVDTYTITFTDGTTTTFDVTNGEDGTVTTDQLMEAIANQLPTDNASGSIASFPDGADDVPVKSLIAQITPLQDLHGYDNPWPAGGGKNLLPTLENTIKTINTGGTWVGNKYSFKGIDYTLQFDSDRNVIGVLVDGTATQESSFTLGSRQAIPFLTEGQEYVLTGCPSGGHAINTYSIVVGDNITGMYYDLGDGKTFTASSGLISNPYFCRIYVANGYTISNKLFKPMLRLSSVSDATFAPYSNICPISGWTGAKITRTGINLWDEEWEVGSLTSGGNNYASTTRYRSKNYVPIKGGEEYYLKNPNGVYDIHFYDINKTHIEYIQRNNSTFTSPANAYYLRFCNDVGTTYNNDVSINYPSTDTSYHAYNGNTINIDWTDEAGTVYGGTLTYIGGGKYSLQANKASVDLGALNYAYDSTRQRFGTTAAITNIKAPSTNAEIVNAISSAYRIISFQNLYDGLDNGVLAVGMTGAMSIRNTAYTAPATFKTAMSGQTLVYELATLPDPIILDAEDVKTLLGDNNIFCDTGDVDVTYRADTALYIEKKLGA